MVDSHCPYCALQCAMSLEPEGERVEVTARDFPTNRGGMCRKGWTSAEVLRAPDRMLTAEETAGVRKRVVKRAAKLLGAELRS